MIAASNLPQPAHPSAPGGRRPAPWRRHLGRNLALGLTVAMILGSMAAVAIVVGRSGGTTGPATYGPPELASRSAGPDFASLAAGLVPASVLGALDVPVSSVVTGHTNHDRSVGTFDRAVSYESSISPSTLLTYFPAALARRHWKVVDASGPVLGRIPASDGFYWEVGITISPAPPTSSIPFGSRFTLRLLQYEGGE